MFDATLIRIDIFFLFKWFFAFIVQLLLHNKPLQKLEAWDQNNHLVSCGFCGDQEFRLGHSEDGLSLLLCVWVFSWRLKGWGAESYDSLTEARGFTSKVTHLRVWQDGARKLVPLSLNLSTGLLR